MTPVLDYQLIARVQKLAAGTDIHEMAQPLAVYQMGSEMLTHAQLNPTQRTDIQHKMTRSEKTLRAFVTQKTLQQFGLSR